MVCILQRTHILITKFTSNTCTTKWHWSRYKQPLPFIYHRLNVCNCKFCEASFEVCTILSSIFKVTRC